MECRCIESNVMTEPAGSSTPTPSGYVSAFCPSSHVSRKASSLAATGPLDSSACSGVAAVITAWCTTHRLRSARPAPFGPGVSLRTLVSPATRTSLTSTALM